MKLKNKMIVLLLITFAILLVVPSMVNAAILDNSTITVSTGKYSSDGSISVSLSGLTLDLTHAYKYSLVKNVSDTPTKWIDLVSPTETTANCVLSATTAEIKEVLKVADTGYLYIKDLNDVEDETDDTNIVEKLPINLKLPLIEAIDIKYSEGNGNVSFDRLYGIGKASYQAVEITEQNIIDTYLSNNRQVSSIVSMLPTSAPINGWNEMSLYSSSAYAYEYNGSLRSNEGLYLIWGQMYGDGCRTIYGYTIYDNLPEEVDAPTEDNEDGEWTDFSKAKFKLERTDLAGANLKISDVTIKEGSHYYLFITSNSNKPNVTSGDENKIYLSYNNESKKFNAVDVSKYVELNQDLYVTILEVKSDSSEKIVLSGKKLERYSEPKYSDAFFASFMTDRDTQLLTSFTHYDEHNRNIQIKIGKITDLSILQKIKNQDASGFASLLTFAKSNNGMYNKTLASNKNYYRIGYMAGEGYNDDNTVIDLTNLKDGEYYFLYIKPDDENGKYITQEAVTLAQASVHEDGEWYLFFYGDEDFEWADFGDVKEDNTTANKELPKTGKYTLVSILMVTIVVGVVSFIKTKKYKGI